MVLRRKVIAIALLAAAGAAAGPHLALAHRTPGSTTIVAWNGRTNHLEIIHRLHVHDVVLGVEPFYDVGPLDVTDPEDQARIVLYVEERFAIELDGKTVSLTSLGAELEGDHLLVYQEGETRLDQGRIRIRNEILRDAFAEQVNEVFLRDGDRVSTLRFAGNGRWVAVDW